MPSARRGASSRSPVRPSPASPRAAHDPRLLLALVRQLRRADLVAEAHLRQRQIDARQDIDVHADLVRLIARVRAQASQDALDLALLLELRLAPAVRQLDDRQRL